MKQLMILFGCIFLLFGGCQQPEKITDAKEEFPEFLVGRWVDQEPRWEFVFEPDGTLSSAVVAVGAVYVNAGETTKYTTEEGKKVVVTPGDWVVDYNPDTHELEVQVVIDYFYLEYGKDAFEGSSTDVFTGTVFQDSEELEMEWYSFNKLVIYIGEEAERFEVPEDPPSEYYKGTLIFTKKPLRE